MTDKLVITKASWARWLLVTGVSLIIGVVILVLVGRQTISQVDSLRPDIEKLLSDNIGLEVSLGQLSGEWPRLVPILEVASVAIIDTDQSPSLVLDKIRAELDLFGSLRHTNAVWRELVIDDLSITMVEDSAGRWSLKGFTGGAETDLGELLKPFMHSRLIHLENIHIDLQSFSGESTSIKGASVKVENDDEFHRSEMSVYFSEQDVPALFVLEGYGDPSDLDSYNAQGYLKIQNFDISAPLVELGKSLMPGSFSELRQFKAGANSEIWLDISQGGRIDIEGTMSVSEVSLDWLADVPPITNISSDIIGWYIPGSSWGFRFQSLDFDWSNTQIEPLDVVFSERLGSQWEDFDVSINHLNLNLLSDLLEKTDALTDSVLTTVDKLRPRGELSVLTFGHNKSGYFASANLENINVSPFKGAPGIKGVNGYLEIEGTKALFHIEDNDGFQLFFPKVYKDYLPVEKAVGTVHAQFNGPDKNLIIRSSNITAQVEAGNANFLFSVERNKNKSIPEVALIIGASDINAAYFNEYLPYKLSPSLLKWLEASNLKGNVREFGLLQRAGPGVDGTVMRSTQLMFDVEAAALDYHPQWLGLRDFDAIVLVDDRFTQGEVSRGTIGGANILNTSLELGGYPLGHPKSNLLTINGELDSSVSEVIGILANSSLVNNLGPLPSWEYEGKVEAQLALQVPLKQSGGTSSAGTYNISSTLIDAHLSIPNTPVRLTQMNGVLNFSNERGLYSDSIIGQLWNQDLSANLAKRNGVQRIFINTIVEPASLNQLVNFPWTKVVTGNIPIEGELTIKGGAEIAQDSLSLGLDDLSPVTLLINSQLESNEIILPWPLGKSASEKRDLALKLHFDSGLTRIEGIMGDKLVADLRFVEGIFSRGVASFDRAASVPSDSEMLISVYLPTVDLDSWRPIATLFGEQPSETQPTWYPVFDMNFDFLEVGALELKQIKSETKFIDGQIDLQFFSNLADGKLLIDDTLGDVPKLTLTRLNMSKDFLAEKVSGQSLDPRTFPASDIVLESVAVDEKLWGNISFQLRPNSEGAAFKNIEGDIFGLRPGELAEEGETLFFWGFDDKQYSSRLTGPVGINNIGDLFEGLEIPTPVDSQSGKLVLDLEWLDQPWSFSKQNMAGNFNVELNQGSFYTSPGGASAALKLVSLFNFANWLRRLQLDFSDVVGENLAYNNLQGKVEFDEGRARLLDPLKMQMPSGRMSMAGEFNLLNETADAQLVATLPVATNLPWVVALLGGIPAAAGVYVTSKIVEKQVDRLSSISYNLNGPWDDIEVSVDKIFAAQLDEKPIETPVPVQSSGNKK